MPWLNPPPTYLADGRTINAQAAARTDFWRKTHNGELRDSGHFYYEAVSGDFVASVKVIGQYAALYDQAGIMVRQDETTWIKCGIEFVNGVQMASAVVTRDYSDWSVRPLANPQAIWLRVARHGGTIEVYISLDGVSYEMIRQAYLSDAPTLNVGVMFCAPTGNGFAVRFEDVVIQR